MDIYHTGKEDVSGDHKFINERLLEVAIPPAPTNGQNLTLEDCLEAYFNNRIEVKRYLERRNTLGSTRSADSLSISKGSTAHVEEIETTPTSTPISSTSPRVEKPSPWSPFAELSDPLNPRKLPRRDSIVRERFVPDSKDTTGDQDSPTSDAHKRKGVYRKEVMMPAWQFFSLIRMVSLLLMVMLANATSPTAWYTDNTPTNDAQVAAHFSSKRPILGLCLKRYSFLPDGKAIRLNTYIDIPTEIGLPHFIQDDNLDMNAPIYGNFKLSLQAIVCHRGDSVDSGHYIAIVRGTSPNAAPQASGQGPQLPSAETPRHWMRFDDLAKERITLIDIDTALKTESPYLLFYQILPIDQDAAMANLPKMWPPSSGVSDATLEGEMSDINQKLLDHAANDASSVDYVSSARPSLEIGPDNARSQSSSVRSVAFSETGPKVPQARSIPSMSPRLAPMEEETSRSSFTFSRRGSRVTKSNPGSRTGSQTGENRISATFSRFAGRLSRDKFASDGEGETEETPVEVDGTTPDELRFSPVAGESKDKGARGRMRDHTLRGQSKEKPKEKNRKPERECVVM